MSGPRVILWDDYPLPLTQRPAPADTPVEEGFKPRDVVTEINHSATDKRERKGGVSVESA